MNTTKNAATVYELGEEGEDWIVVGVTAADAAIAAARHHQINQWGESLEQATGEDHVELKAGPYRTDWAWSPIDDLDPMDEALLVHGDEAEGLLQFAGWRVSVA